MTRLTLIDNKKAYVDGYKSIISIEDNEIKILCHDRVLIIYGEKLRIASFTGIEMAVEGKLHNISWSK